MIARRIITVPLLCLVLLITGCTAPRFAAFSYQGRTLDEARDHIRAGQDQQARALLEKVVESEPTPGVTDEVLFRLALLTLNEVGGKGSQRSQSLLEKLAATFPDSIWTRQSAPLLTHLTEHRALRNRNYSLSRDNKEMRQSLEQLKRLDLELEQRIKR